LIGRRACGEYAGNKVSAFCRVVQDVPSSMLEQLGHGAIGSLLADGNDRSLLALRRWDARRLRTDPFARLLTVQATHEICGQKGTRAGIVSTGLAPQTGIIRRGRGCCRFDLLASSSVVRARQADFADPAGFVELVTLRTRARFNRVRLRKLAIAALAVKM